MTSLRHVGHFGSLTQPEVPVETRRRIGRFPGPAAGSATNRAGGRQLLAQPPALRQHDRLEKHRVVFAPLLRADVQDLAGLFHHLADLLAFVDGQRQWLLALHVFAGLQRVDDDLRVPVIGRADGHHVDVVAIQHLAIVRVDLALAVELVPGGKSLTVTLVHIRTSHDVGEPRGAAAIAAYPSRPHRCRPGCGRSFLSCARA